MTLNLWQLDIVFSVTFPVYAVIEIWAFYILDMRTAAKEIKYPHAKKKKLKMHTFINEKFLHL